MPEKPILFTAPMVRAILDGPKTVTRRLLKPQPEAHWTTRREFYQNPKGGLFAEFRSDAGPWMRRLHHIKCPYRKGDILWVRETWACLQYDGGGDDGLCGSHENVPVGTPGSFFAYAADTHWPDHKDDRGFSWKPPRFMPKSASRIRLRVLADPVPERVQDITEEEAVSEGIFSMPEDFKQQCARLALATGEPASTARWQYRCLWNSLYGLWEWERNDWVWPIRFERVKT